MGDICVPGFYHGFILPKETRYSNTFTHSFLSYVFVLDFVEIHSNVALLMAWGGDIIRKGTCPKHSVWAMWMF